jgi:hypothetical protein
LSASTNGLSRFRSAARSPLRSRCAGLRTWRLSIALERRRMWKASVNRVVGPSSASRSWVQRVKIRRLRPQNGAPGTWESAHPTHSRPRLSPLHSPEPRDVRDDLPHGLNRSLDHGAGCTVRRIASLAQAGQADTTELRVQGRRANLPKCQTSDR